MKDRFRYRCWDKVDKKFIAINCIHPLLLQMNEDRYVLTQCTGLKDKNGRLIYEGDIVEIATEEENAIIKWEDDTANFSIHILSENVIVTFDNYWSHQLEIIGDIFAYEEQNNFDYNEWLNNVS